MKVPLKKLNDGVEIPMLGLGTWRLEKELCEKAVRSAIEIGYRHIDTANAYENHTAISEALQGTKREDFFITSKLWRDFHDPKIVEKMCDQSLLELKMDYLDLYLVHWPERKKAFPEIVHMMHRLKEKGKVRSVGLCNATVHHIQDLFNQKVEISLNQIELHPYFNQEELYKFCLMHNIAITAYCPLTRGAVYQDPLLKEIGQSFGKTPGQVALRWMIQKDIIAIPKASSEPHLRENFEIFDFKLTEEMIRKINALSKNMRLISPDFNEFDY